MVLVVDNSCCLTLVMMAGGDQRSQVFNICTCKSYSWFIKVVKERLMMCIIVYIVTYSCGIIETHFASDIVWLWDCLMCTTQNIPIDSLGIISTSWPRYLQASRLLAPRDAPYRLQGSTAVNHHGTQGLTKTFQQARYTVRMYRL